MTTYFFYVRDFIVYLIEEHEKEFFIERGKLSVGSIREEIQERLNERIKCCDLGMDSWDKVGAMLCLKSCDLLPEGFKKHISTEIYVDAGVVADADQTVFGRRDLFVKLGVSLKDIIFFFGVECNLSRGICRNSKPVLARVTTV